MTQSPETKSSLLKRIRNSGDERSWAEFVDIYAPLVYGYCVKQGIQHADASDVSQEVLQAIVSAIGKFEYDPERGGFRRWLMTVIRSKVNNFYNRRGRQAQGTGETAVHKLLDAQPGPEEEAAWERDYQRHMFQWAAEQTRDEFQEDTWKAFWMSTIEDLPSREIADTLEMSVGAVYIAKSRVLARLKAKIEEVEGE